MGYYKNSFGSVGGGADSEAKDNLKTWLYFSPIPLGSVYFLIAIFFFEAQPFQSDTLSSIYPYIFYPSILAMVILFTPIVESNWLVRVIIGITLCILGLLIISAPFVAGQNYLENIVSSIFIVIYISGSLLLLRKLHLSAKKENK